VDDTPSSFFSALFAYLSHPVELKIEENIVEFTPSFEDKNDEILMTFEYGENE